MSPTTVDPPDEAPPVPVPVVRGPAPGHSRPRTRRRWLLPAVVVVVIAIAASVAVLASRHDGSKSATNHVSTKTKQATDAETKSNPPSATSVGENTLQASVPTTFASTCAPAQANSEVTGASAHIACTDGHLDVDYYLFAGRSSLATYWRKARAAKDGVAGICSDDMREIVENYYQGDRTHLAGQLLCYHARQAAHIQWEQPDQLIVATANFSGNNQGMAHGHLVQEWRRDDLGPREEAKKPVARHPCSDQDCLGP